MLSSFNGLLVLAFDHTPGMWNGDFVMQRCCTLILIGSRFELLPAYAVIFSALPFLALAYLLGKRGGEFYVPAFVVSQDYAQLVGSDF
jgi:hypothetical protein